MILPGVLYLFINNYIPMAGIFIAFKDIDFSLGIFKSKWVGFKISNFCLRQVTHGLLQGIRFYITWPFIVLGTIVGVMMAVLLNELISARFRKVYQTVLLLPQLISMVVVAYIVYAFLNTESGLLTIPFLNL